MKKRSFILSIALLLVFLTAALAGCAPSVKTETVYKHYLYDGYSSKFITTGNTLAFYNDLTFIETFPRMSSGDSAVLAPYSMEGTYVADSQTNSVLGYVTAASFSSFVKNYKKELKEAGYSSTYINLVASALTDTPDYYLHKNYIFKLSALQAARYGSVSENLNTIEGVYSMPGYTSSGASTVKLEKGRVYYQSNIESEDSPYDTLSATYTIRGDFLEIVPNPDNKNNNLPVSQKFLMATIILPDLTTSEINSSVVDLGDISDDLKSQMSFKKLRVLLLDFYSYKTF